ncbi:MAG: EF-hand domain-containing protein [Gallionella sp.]|nr:EF-hand domain-containing protein [Gallionella sp.]
MRKWIVSILLIALPCSAIAAADSKKEQNANFDQMFRAMDTNKSGKISMAEAELKAPALAENFDLIDENRDGGLTKKEIRQAFDAAEKRRSEFSRKLQAADKDNNGKLSREEATALPKISASFDEIDSNADGQLVIKEIADFVRARGSAVPVTVSSSTRP